ncbi:hypothetical protein [Helicobacter cappadocius]|uniref:Uncharacterized protein n=1 Tax=Helicobacter cappadocius TaxID=3063998 RepID=A0AA90PT68_9HELI|nr:MULTISPECIES: hypothetical protein [unclassified Helicobacter]MDO7252418.1 hypothetical protein [Helicobacter sp. faydin-H75]MDP2538285.1 hypothetical protein [Helicobacter sp. faydin-H76]
MKYSKAQGLFYALMVLLAVAYISTASLRMQGVRIDAMSNSHLKYQSSLYVQSILEMAKLCLKTLTKEQCDNDEFIFDKEYKGGYNLFDIDDGYEIHIYIQAINLRTSQVQRTLARTYLLTEKKPDL